MTRPILTVSALALILALALGAAGDSIFAKDNLVAWCIVPFDASKRGPEERAAMLDELGIRKLAYDWRAEHIPTFGDELDALDRHNIELTAFWIPCGPNPEKDEAANIALDLLEKRGVKTQIWVNLDGAVTKSLDGLSQSGKVAAAARPLRYMATRAAKMGNQIALYNHGGWFGEPENQIEIIEHLGMDNVGIVYSFHHGREHMDRFATMFRTMQPHLIALNLNGMREGGPMIMPLGTGDRELEMMRIVQQSGWRGPVGILDHRNEMDAKESLQQNIDGMEKLVEQLGDKAALATY